MKAFLRRHWGGILLAIMWAFMLSAIIFGGAGNFQSSLNPDR